MQPIVNGFEEVYSDNMAFVYLNANTDGQMIYETLNLRGHPAYVIFQTDGTEVFRTLGHQPESSLEEAIQVNIDESE